MRSRVFAAFRGPRLYLSALLGTSAALLIYSYLLVDYLPPNGRLILFCTLLAALAGAAAYYVLLGAASGSASISMSAGTRWAFLAGSIVVGLYLTYCYLGGQGASPRYIQFLLPRQSLHIAVPSDVNPSGGRVVLSRFMTSTGDVSYGTLQLRGWKRQGTDLILSLPAANSLEWQGTTGDAALLIFGAPTGPLAVDVAWNGHTERVIVPIEASGKSQLAYSFSVPPYASQSFLLILGALVFIVACYGLDALIWKHRASILDLLGRSYSELRSQKSTPLRLQRLDWVLMACLMGLALLLRVFNLDRLYPYTDEYAHLLAAKALLQGAPLSSVFDRSLFVVTVPVWASLRVFGAQLWAARLPGVLCNTVAIVPLYYLTCKINRPVAVLAALLFATSPWMIALSRNIREYAYYPFYFFWIIYAMVTVVEQLPSRLHIVTDWKRFFRRDLLFPVVALLFVPFYAVFLDARSTVKIIVIAYGVFALFLVLKFDLRSKSNWLVLGPLIAVALVLAAAYAQGFGHSGMSISPQFRIAALSFFFPDPVQQWYFARIPIVPAGALVAAGAIGYRTWRTNILPSFLGALLLASAVFFTVFFGYLLIPRYWTSMQLWFIAVMAMGIYGLFVFASRLPFREIATPILATTAFAFTFNIPQSLAPILYDKQGVEPITTDYHLNMGPAYSYLRDRVSDQDVLLSTVFADYVRWQGAPQFRQMVPYRFVRYSVKYKWILPYEAIDPVAQTPQELIQSVMQENDSGWIVLDLLTYSSTLAKPLPLKDSVIGGKLLQYDGNFGGEYVWRWQATPPADQALPPAP